MSTSSSQPLSFQGLMQKSLTDLVRGIRSHKKDESAYISQALHDIKEELRSPNMTVKSVAVQKLAYLKMLGYDISWAAFNVIEVMSASRFTTKRLAYLAASLSFTEQTDVAMLATNLIRKDLAASNQYEAGAALNCLANICTPDLARDLAADVVGVLNTSRPYVRKKAVLVLYRIFLRFPDALRPAFPRLREKLEDPDPAVVSAAVNVICELARKNPANYLPLAPLLFKLLTNGSTNNWMLIKIVKLFGALTPLEPRLSKKLVEPITHLINTTPAMSLLYECIHTACVGMSDQVGLMRLCLSKLRQFVEDPDQNLKYLGLVALGLIMDAYPKALLEYKDLVLWCLTDEDESIRSRALNLLQGMVNKKTLQDIITKLVVLLDKADGVFRDELVEQIVTLCAQQQYAHIVDFEWYLGVLVGLARSGPTVRHGRLLAVQLLDVVIRVKALRPMAHRYMLLLLSDLALLQARLPHDSRAEILYAAAWIIGEFGSELLSQVPQDANNGLSQVIDALLQPTVAQLPSAVQATFLHNLLKLLARATPEQLPSLLTNVITLLEPFTQSASLEVQERTCFALELVNQIKEDPELVHELPHLFADPLNPVAAGSQKKVPIPAGLDLDTPLHPDASVLDSMDAEADDDLWEASADVKAIWGTSEPSAPASPITQFADSERQRQARKARQQSSDYYLKDDVGAGGMQQLSASDLGIAPNVPLVQNASPSLLAVLTSNNKKTGKKKKAGVPLEVDRSDELPEGVVAEVQTKGRKGAANNGEFDALAAIDLTKELQPMESLPVATHRVVVAAVPAKKPTKKAAAAPAVAETKGKKTTKKTKADGEGAVATKTKKSAATAPAADPYQTISSPTPVVASGKKKVVKKASASATPTTDAPAAKKTVVKKTATKGEAVTKKTVKTTDAPAKSPAPTPAAAVTTPAAPAPAAAAATPLKSVQDATLSVEWEAKVSNAPNMTDKLLLEIRLKLKQEASNISISLVSDKPEEYLSSKGLRQLQAIRVDPADGSSAEFYKAKANDKRASGSLVRFNVLLQIQQYAHLPATLPYTVSYEDATHNVVELKVPLPVLSSSLVQRAPMSAAQFTEKLTETANLVSLQTTLEPSGGLDVRQLLARLASELHLAVVESSAGAVTLSGRTVGGVPVFALVKAKPNSASVSLDLKSTDSALVQSLLNEAQLLAK